MKIVLYNDYSPGVLVEGGVVDISSQVSLGRTGQETLESLIEHWASLKPRIERYVATAPPVPLESVELRAPVPRPGKIMCMAANFREDTQAPLIPMNGFLVSPEAILDPGGTVVLPRHEFTICHHEAELVAVISKEGRNIPSDKASDYIFGYTAGVDVSARGGWGFLGKSCDSFKPLGPCIVTADEIENPHALEVRLSVDGELRQDYNTTDMAHQIPECIEWFSSLMTILPGDLLFVGTNHQQLGPLQDGESAEMTIEGIGSFGFSVSDLEKRVWPKGIDRAMGATVQQRVLEGVQPSQSPLRS